MITNDIQSILDKMYQMFHSAIGPRTRREYMESIAIICNRDWHFSLTADEIIDKKIPANVMGCTGRAKVFCKMAADIGIECYAVCTAVNRDRELAKQGIKTSRGREPTIGGHQIIAVKINGKLKMFDPGRPELTFLPEDVRIGNLVNFHFTDGSDPYLITAIMTPDEYAKVNTYQKLRNIYASGDINNPNFMIEPK